MMMKLSVSVLLLVCAATQSTFGEDVEDSGSSSGEFDCDLCSEAAACFAKPVCSAVTGELDLETYPSCNVAAAMCKECFPESPCGGGDILLKKGPYECERSTVSYDQMDSSDQNIEVWTPRNIDGPSPLIVFMHGRGGGGEPLAVYYGDLLCRLAGWGYVVAAPRACDVGCVDDTEPSQIPTNPAMFDNFWKEQLKVIDFAQEYMSDQIDFSAGIGVAGQSMGGQATMFSATHLAKGNKTYDIRAAVTHNPFTYVYTETKVPLMIFTGSADTTAPPLLAKALYAKESAERKLIVNKVGGVHTDVVLDSDPLIAQFTAAWFTKYLGTSNRRTQIVDIDEMLYGTGPTSICNGGFEEVVEGMCGTPTPDTIEECPLCSAFGICYIEPVCDSETGEQDPLNPLCNAEVISDSCDSCYSSSACGIPYNGTAPTPAPVGNPCDACMVAAPCFFQPLCDYATGEVDVALFPACGIAQQACRLCYPDSPCGGPVVVATSPPSPSPTSLPTPRPTGLTTTAPTPNLTPSPTTTAPTLSPTPAEPVVLKHVYFNTTSFPDLAKTRHNAMKGMTSYIVQGFPTNCSHDEYHEYHPDGIKYDNMGTVILVHEPCNMESSFIAFDRLVTPDTIIIADIASYLAFGSGFFHATTCAGGESIPNKFDTVPIQLMFAKLLQQLIPEANYTQKDGTVRTFSQIDDVVAQVKDALDSSDPSTWDRILSIEGLVPSYGPLQVLLVKRLYPLCNSQNTATLDSTINMVYGGLRPNEKAFVDGYSSFPNPIRENAALCGELTQVMVAYLGAITHQEQMLPIEQSSVYSADTPRTERDCSKIPHARWHEEISAVMGSLAKITTSASTPEQPVSTDKPTTLLTTTATTPPTCVEFVDNCRICSPSSDSCDKCMNSKYLHDGVCVTACPLEFVGVGTGKFSRICELEATTTTTNAPNPNPNPNPAVCGEKQNSCRFCTDDDDACAKCMDAKYLHNGTCIDICPDGFNGVGNGKFGRECEAVPVQFACVEGKDGCRFCSGVVDDDVCWKCMDSKYLHNGACIDTCPDGFNGVGNGKYSRECEAVPPACVEKKDSCRFCTDDDDACAKCMNSKYLHNGACIDTCPNGYTGVGAGRFSRVCRAATPACAEKRDDCRFCNQEKRACTKCMNSKYLHDGLCVGACPSPFVPVGTGQYSRICAQ